MKTICKMLKRDSKGFTLVELMVVLLIIGILVAIAIPIYNATQKNAKMKACQANIRTINGAVSQWAAANNKEPAELAELENEDDQAAALNPYLKDGFDNITCPFTKEPYEIGDDGFVDESDHDHDKSGHDYDESDHDHEDD